MSAGMFVGPIVILSLVGTAAVAMLLCLVMIIELAIVKMSNRVVRFLFLGIFSHPFCFLFPDSTYP